MDCKLPKYSQGYPLCFQDRGAERWEPFLLCHDCAERMIADGRRTAFNMVANVNWESPELYCDDCSERIEAAYGEASRAQT